MFYIYRPQSSTGARELANALQGQRLRNFEGNRFVRRFRSGRLVPVALTGQDHIVCWGAHAPAQTGLNILNNAPLRNKFSDIEALTRAGVPTVVASRTRPAPQTRQVPVVDPALALFQRAQQLAGEFSDIEIEGSQVPRTAVLQRATQELRESAVHLIAALVQPIPAPRVEQTQPAGEWVGRTNDHVGGADLLAPPATPDYYVRREQITEEFRVHSFLGRSIRAGAKRLREGFSETAPRSANRASDWVRSWDGGWRIVYDGVSATQEVRDLAHRAVAALGLQFGAVDIGRKADGTLIVLEVNRAPGLEGGTIDRYVAAIRNWASGEWRMRTVEEAAQARAARPRRQGQRRTQRRAA